MQQAGYGVARLFVTLWAWHLEPHLWWEKLLRNAPHLALATLIAGILLLARAAPPAAPVRFPVLAESVPGAPAYAASASLYGMAQRTAMSFARPAEVVIRQAQPRTQPLAPVPQPRIGIVWYTAQIGDTVESVAAQFGLRPTTLIWANPRLEKLPQQLLPGQVLRILPVDGVYHQVRPDETLLDIAQTYSSTVESILTCPYNAITDTLSLQLAPGTALIIPDGVKPEVFRKIVPYTGPIPPDAVGTGHFIWPVSPEYAFLSQWYWWGHQAVDLAAPLGSAVRAADTGYVSFAGWVDNGYGNLVVLDHQNGYETYYGHFDKILVEEGQRVQQGQVLGMMGDTGRSSGPHVHFEIRYQGAPVNPFRYLPAWEGYIWW